MKRPLVLLACLVALAVAAPAAHAQSDAFGPIPPPAPEQTAVPEPSDDDNVLGTDDEVSQTTLAIILGAVVALFVAIGYFITRDARGALPDDARRDDPRLREEAAPRRPKQAKAKARAKTRAQKQARKATRRRS